MANLLFSSYCVYQKVGMRYLSETTLCLPLLYYTFGKRDIIGMVCLHLNRKDFHFIREIILLFPNQIQIPNTKQVYLPTHHKSKQTYIWQYLPPSHFFITIFNIIPAENEMKEIFVQIYMNIHTYIFLLQ